MRQASVRQQGGMQQQAKQTQSPPGPTAKWMRVLSPVLGANWMDAHSNIKPSDAKNPSDTDILFEC